MAPRDVPEAEEAAFEEPLEDMPRVSLELVQWLERRFPSRCKNVTEPLEAHMVYAGHVGLAQNLRAIHTRQQGGHKLRYSIRTGLVIDETTSLNPPRPPSRPQGKPSAPRRPNR